VLSSADVGRRVVVRRRVAAGFTDTIGRLIAADAGALVVRPDRGGADVAISLPDVVAAKPVPPRRRRVGIDDLERITAAAWPALERERLGDWLLRAADGWTGRANSALVVGDPGRALPAAIAAVTSWYRERALHPACQVPLPAATDVDAFLADAGWEASVPVLVMTAPIDRVRRTVADGLPPVTLTPTASDDWLALFGARKRGMPSAVRALLAGGNATFAEVRDADGGLIAAARSALGDGHLGLFAIEVVPEHRRRGLARHVMAALADAAFDHAHTVYLQAEDTNIPARALYDRLGFTVHHTYMHRRL